jgi:predicted DNA binding CopG/RHH family protein
MTKDDCTIPAIVERLNAMDKAAALLHDNLVRVPTEIDRREDALKELFDTKIDFLKQKIDDVKTFAHTRESTGIEVLFAERFKSIELRFSERDLRFSQTELSHQSAIQSALAAVSLANDKNEKSFTKQVDAITANIVSNTVNIDTRIEDLKQRITMFEGRNSGVSNSLGWIVAAITTIAAIISAFTHMNFTATH